MVPKWIFFFVIIGFYYNVKRSRAVDTKMWNKYTNFDNSRNWEGGRLPCKNDRVIFPASKAFAVFMPESFSVAEMVLPLNGEFIFPDNATFAINGRGSPEGSCIGQDIKFSPRTDSWYDPDNWNITSSNHAFPLHSTAVPHAFRIPCRKDQAHFPPKTTFRVHAMNPAPSVALLKINNLAYTQAEFEALVNTRTGKLLFPENPKIQIDSSPCTDGTGCLCGNEEPQVLSVICKYKLPCPKLECMDPIQVTGHCCPICAAKLLLEYQPHFKMASLLQFIMNLQDTETYRTVESYTSKIADGNIQSVFVDSNANQVANTLAQFIYKAFTTASDDMYGIRSVRIQKSEKWILLPGSDYTSGGMSSGGIAALVIMIIVASGIAAFLYVYRKRQIQGFSFARFDLRSDKIELELGTTPHDELEPGDDPAPSSSEGTKDRSKGFDNPVYGTDITSEASAPIEEIPEVRDFVENPMFMIFEDSPKKEDTLNAT